MKTLKGTALFLLLSLLPACGQQLVEFPNPTADAGTADARKLDVAVANPDVANPDVAAVNIDMGNIDARRPDVANPDLPAANPDAGNTDAVTTDARSPDGANPDVPAANPDLPLVNHEAGNTDVVTIDARNPDGANPDVPAANPDLPVANHDVPAANIEVGNIGTANPDATNPDVGNIDAANPNAGNPDTEANEVATSDTGSTDTSSACAQAPVVLGAAGNFVVLAGSTVTNAGPTSVTGDLGVSPGTAVTGFPPGTLVGAQHAGDSTAAQGVADLTTAYNDAAGRTLCPVTVAGNIGGQTLTPGLYKSTSSLEISSGDLTLDAQGDADAVFIFQIASTLTTTSGRQVVLSGSAKSTNVFWQVGTSATLGTTSAFQGTIMADQAITLNTSATLNGRALARIAAVTLDSNTIVKPAP